MIALLLAQLVMPSPSVEPLPPPGMICMGECSDGPMVWRASPARGRLVVACDMRSDTCSDGRKITTVRATPVPCEVSPGVWEMVPEDTGCYGVRGLESWAANTSYLAYGAELTNSAWSGDATVLPLGNVSWVFGSDAASIGQTVGGAASGDWTFTCIMRASDTTTGHTARISVGEASCDAELNPSHNSTGVGWGTYSCSTELEEEGPLTAQIWPQSMVGVDVIGCWLTRTDTPGRPCWGGEAPVTCAADRHTISTEGWPTESGEISITFILSPGADTTESRYILDVREAAAVGNYLRVSSVGNLQALVSGIGLFTIAPVEPRVAPYALRVVAKDGLLRFILDGVERTSREGNLHEWPADAFLGSTFGGTSHLNGSISSLRVRSSE